MYPCLLFPPLAHQKGVLSQIIDVHTTASASYKIPSENTKSTKFQSQLEHTRNYHNTKILSLTIQETIYNLHKIQVSLIKPFRTVDIYGFKIDCNQ